MSPIRVNHIAVVAPDFEQSMSFWRDVLGLEVTETEHNEAEAVDVAFFSIGNTQLELIAPITEDSGVAKYLAKRGAGVHHLCIEVEDIDTTMNKLREKGVELINEAPRTRESGIRYAFTHPKSTGGVMIELYEMPE
jgi:methylmalonyl-CoA/ethylmalonyl-CoA epimerase